MLESTSLRGNIPESIKLSQGLNGKTPILSSLQMNWHGVLVEEYQYSPTPDNKESPPLEVPALRDHWLVLPLGQPIYLSQKSDDCLYESIFQKGDSLLVPAGRSTCWRCQGGRSLQRELHIRLQPTLVEKVAEACGMNTQPDLINHFAKQDLTLQHLAMLLLTELRSGGIMGQLYVESLTQALAVHLLRHYSGSGHTIATEVSSLTQAQLQPAIDYIHAYLNRNLSLTELANVINISPTYFASLFKRAMGISPHQYVIQQRVEKAKEMLSKTDLAIADIALQVGFSSQSHLTQQFKQVTGITPKQAR